ncbi:MAG: PAS domain-containing protein [Bacillota bacterium]
MFDKNISKNEICQHLTNVIIDARTAFVFFDKDGKIKFYNNIFNKMLNLNKDSYINDNIFELLNLKNTLLEYINEKTKIEFTKTLEVKDEKILVNLYFSKCKEPTKNVDSYVIINSLTSMERQVDDLLVRELDMQSLIDESLIGMFVVNQEHKIIRANKVFNKLLGYEDNELLDMYTWEILKNYNKKTIQKDFADLSKAVNQVKVTFIKKKNQTIDVRVMGKGGKVKGEPVMIYFVDTFPRE